ncbi:hypothetical protein C7K43_08925 [Tetragenococcus koreensis]|nr:hypothetical protein C7K43_08925 [Tetragenococcus koreensis]
MHKFLEIIQDERYFIFFTFTTKQANFKKIRQLVGQRLKIIPANDMQQITGQKSGAFSPFSYDQSVSMIVVEELLS